MGGLDRLFSVFFLVFILASAYVLAEENQSSDSGSQSTDIITEPTVEPPAEVTIDAQQNGTITDTQMEPDAQNETALEDTLPSEEQNSSIEENITIEPVTNDTLPVIPENDSIEQNTTVEQNITDTNYSVEISNLTVVDNNQSEQNETETNTTLIPDFIKTILDVITDKINALIGEVIKITAVLTTENKTPLANKPVDFYFDEQKIATETTDNNGRAEIIYNTSQLTPGTYVIGVNFSGDSNAESSANVKELVVEEAIQNITTNLTVNLTENLTTNLTNTTIVNETTNMTSGNIELIQDCIDVPYSETQDIFEDCSKNTDVTVCEDNTNTTCHIEKQFVSNQCLKERKTIQKVQKECKTTGYIINHAVKIITQDYACSSEEIKDETTLTCDSVYDGNGDGICTSGESCMKFIVKGVGATALQKNSKEDFVENDKTFYLNQGQVESIAK